MGLSSLAVVLLFFLPICAPEGYVRKPAALSKQVVVPRPSRLSAVLSVAASVAASPCWHTRQAVTAAARLAVPG